MNIRLPDTLIRLVQALEVLPSIGPRTALRLAFFLLECKPGQAQGIADAIMRVRSEISWCPDCGCLIDQSGCRICQDPTRDSSSICVVARARDVYTIEESGAFGGRYHVLGGLLSPLNRIGPSELNIDKLLRRLSNVSEVIIATAPTVEGDATAIYLSGLIKVKGISVTRLAYGLPAGGDIEFTDAVTLARALEGRRLVDAE